MGSQSSRLLSTVVPDVLADCGVIDPTLGVLPSPFGSELTVSMGLHGFKLGFSSLDDGWSLLTLGDGVFDASWLGASEFATTTEHKSNTIIYME